ncbi:MAG TPA: hypothetical protein VGP85_22700 [Pyrinomonadaceae bacterium]|nr:hypothetical protein [Pyrinomonadaceae bacterium]
MSGLPMEDVMSNSNARNSRFAPVDWPGCRNTTSTVLVLTLNGIGIKAGFA